MRKLLLALMFIGCCTPAFAAIPHSGVWYDAPSGGGGGIAIGGAEIGTCPTGDIMILDLNGVVRCPSLTTTDPADVLVRSGSCYELDGTCTAPDLNIVAGLDTKQFTTVVQANCAAADNARAVVRDKTNTVLANCDCTVGTTWTCITDNNTCATGLATCLDACPGLSAQSSAATVGVRPDVTTMSVTLSMSTDAGGVCAVASNGTDGTTNIVAPLNIPTVAGASAMSVAANGTTIMNAVTTANSGWTFASTIDARGAISSGTGDLSFNDNGQFNGNKLYAYKHSLTTDIDGRVITAAESGERFDNVGDTNNAAYTLPAAAAGLFYTWSVVTEVAGDDITVTSAGDDVIQLGTFTSGAADCVDVVGLGSVMYCEAKTATQWFCECRAGTCDTTCP